MKGVSHPYKRVMIIKVIRVVPVGVHAHVRVMRSLKQRRSVGEVVKGVEGVVGQLDIVLFIEELELRVRSVANEKGKRDDTLCHDWPGSDRDRKEES